MWLYGRVPPSLMGRPCRSTVGASERKWEHLVSRLPYSLPSPELVFLGALYLRWLIFSSTRVMFEYPCVRKGRRKEFEFPIMSAFLGILWDGFLDKALILFFLYFQHEVSESLLCVKLKILSNWGHTKYTCLYRFRVHGTPGDHTHLEELVQKVTARGLGQPSVPAPSLHYTQRGGNRQWEGNLKVDEFY